MSARRTILSIAAIVLLLTASYVFVAVNLLPQTQPVEQGQRDTQTSVPTTATDSRTLANPGPESVTDKDPESTLPVFASAGRKYVEVYGRVTDRNGRPLEGVAIAEERYFHHARSDPDGNYKIAIELPRHRYPVLHFLRSGYAARHYELGQRDLDQNPVYRLDVQLDDAIDSVTLQGWVGNELGIGLEGARVELGARNAEDSEAFYLTRFSDAQGRFSFEGVQAGQLYRLSVNLTPEYPFYVDENLLVTASPVPINITLPTLTFVDVQGMIVTRDATPVSELEIYVTNATTGIHTRKIVSDSSGFFSLRNFPLGELVVTTRGPEYFSISGLQLTAEGYGNLQIVVDRGDHYLSGWVSDEHGVALERAMVTVDRKYRLEGVEHSSYRSQSTDRNGQFRFSNLGSGEYQVSAYAWGYQKQVQSVNFGEQSAAIQIQLQPGS